MGLRSFHKITLVAAWLCCFAELRAQDIHFSQVQQSPFSYSTSSVGDFNGRHRFMAAQRTQWRSVTTPYDTWAISYDIRLRRVKDIVDKKNKIDSDCPPQFGRLNAGIALVRDRAGDSKLTTNTLQAIVSYNGNLGSVACVPSLGLGLASMSIDMSQLNFDNQWTGFVFDPNLQSGEVLSTQSFSYLQLHGGLLLKQNLKSGGYWKLLLGANNLSSPKQSWFDNSFVRLDKRYTVQAIVSLRASTRVQVVPSLLWMGQGKYRELIAGGEVHTSLVESKWQKRTLITGVFWRAADAGFVTLGMQYDDWRVSLSYDLNVSDLSTASNNKGGLEVCASWIIPANPVICVTKKNCPDFL